MLELRNITKIFSGVPVREGGDGPSRFVRLTDLSELRARRIPLLATGEAPAVARALTIEEGDLIVGARGGSTDVCVATDPVFGAFVSLDLYLVRPDPTRVKPEYLAAFLELPATQARFAMGKQGSGLARLGKDALEKTEIPLPPMHEQQLIVELARTLEEEDRFLKKIAELKSCFGREVIARAIRATGIRPNFPRSVP